MGKYIRKDTPFTTAHVKDIRGQRFGKLVVKEFGHSDKIHAYWLCECDCGNTTVKSTQQVRNRRKTVYLIYNGEKRPLTEWCEILGLNKKTVYGRLHDYGWTNPQEILFGKGGTKLCQET